MKNTGLLGCPPYIWIVNCLFVLLPNVYKANKEEE